VRPLELRLRNFRSYFGEESVFSFRERSLVGIVGPIGAGKSTILDAIAFALYGKTPTVAAATKTLIHQRAADATVALRFEVDGEVWEAVRLLRVKGQSQHALYRLEADRPEEEPIERITMEGDVNARIVELLGLEFDAFGRSVLLAQNRFAEFLRARPVERDKVLKGVFGHDRLDAMRDAAKARSAALRIDLEKLGIRVEQLDRLAARLEELEEQARTLDGRVAALREAKPEFDALEGRIEDAGDRLSAAERRAAELGDLAERLPDPAITSRLLDEAAGAAEKRAALAGVLESAQDALTEADRALAEAEDRGITRTIEAASSKLAELAPTDRTASEALQRVRSVAARIRDHEEKRSKATARADAAEEAEGAAEAEAAARARAVAEAEAALVEQRHAEMATTLRAELHEGGECPVCAQVVPVVPDVEPSPGVAAAEQALVEASAHRDRADRARLRAAAEAQGAREALQAIDVEDVRLTDERAAVDAAARSAAAALDAVRDSLADLLGPGDPQELLQRLKESHAGRQSAAADARKAVERARADHDAAIREQQELGKQLSALQVTLIGLIAKLDAPMTIDDDTPQTLRAVLANVRTAWSEMGSDLQREKTRAREDVAAASRQRDRLLASLEVDGAFGEVLANAAAEAQMTARAIAADREELAEAGSLIEQRNAAEAERARYEQISSDLTDSRFVRYLLDDERTRLAALGSEHFERLSSGRYRFSEDGKFDIVDLTAAEAVRKADSLSGGETFLASLALALALAEMVARTGGRLDAFFLDEGFGSLDPEHLDLAMEGIEALVADGGGRLVVVVSHVPELRSRVEDLIVLDRNPVTGDTRVLSA
jgi:exonuclease SbcC